MDVVTVAERGWTNHSDDELLPAAVGMRRFVPTHDADFGRLAIAEKQPIHGVLFLRPGDHRPEEVIDGLRPLVARTIDWSPPMIAVYRSGRLRVRRPPR